MNAFALTGASAALGKFGLTGISGAATTYTTNALTLPYAIRGKAYTKAQVSGGTTPTTDSAPGVNNGLTILLTAGFGRIVVWGVNAAGTVQVCAGPIVALDSANAFILASQFPSLPLDFCPCAYTLHKAGSTVVGTWQFGVSNWNATGMVHVVQDLALGMPDRPQNS